MRLLSLLLPVLWLGLGAPTWADTPAPPVAVLFTGDPQHAQDEVIRTGHLHGEALDMKRLIDLAPGTAPYVVGLPSPIRCTPTPASAVREGLENAEALFDHTAEAEADLEQARMDLECLGEPVDPDLAARVFFLGGFLAWRGGSNPTAEASFYRAMLFKPDLGWDTVRGGPVAPASFAAAQARLASGQKSTLRVIPAVAAGFEVRVDGLAVDTSAGTVTLREGIHLVQVVAQNHVDSPLIVPLMPDQELELVLPVALSESLLMHLDTPLVRDSLAPILRDTWPDQVVYVYGRGVVWRFTAKTGTWQNLSGK